jgi:EAL domain-containing protein (putative c-di-GMP-specific phosphodiesterase class I)
VSLAVDDTGAGYASLHHILQLKPDLLKLDRGLTAEIDSDPVRRALGAALVRFADDIGAETVAEGIETPQSLDTVRSLGMHHGQGFVIGRPGSLDDITRRYGAA